MCKAQLVFTLTLQQKLGGKKVCNIKSYEMIKKETNAPNNKMVRTAMKTKMQDTSRKLYCNVFIMAPAKPLAKLLVNTLQHLQIYCLEQKQTALLSSSWFLSCQTAASFQPGKLAGAFHSLFHQWSMSVLVCFSP